VAYDNIILENQQQKRKRKIKRKCNLATRALIVCIGWLCLNAIQQYNKLYEYLAYNISKTKNSNNGRIFNGRIFIVNYYGRMHFSSVAQ